VIFLGPTNAIRHPFMERSDVIAAGPAETLGHPFRIVTEVPLERQIGKHRTFSFGTKWLYSDLDVSFDEDVEAVVVWDPGWLRTGTGEGAIHELQKIWDLAQDWNAPVIGLFSDWFAAWEVEEGIIGTKAATMYMDGIIVDYAGSSALRHSVHPLTVVDKNDRRYCPMLNDDAFLTYGRLPRIGGGIQVEMKPPVEREVDVAMVSTLHPQHVLLRPYYVDKMMALCRANGWSFSWTNKATAEEMEELYLNSKVVFNCSLGSQPNCRVYEALACGCMLLTDGWNIGMKGVPCARYSDAWELEIMLRDMLTMGVDQQHRMQLQGLMWAAQRTPEKTWERILDDALLLAKRTHSARDVRKKFRQQFEAEHAAH
jgi:glycosyl transferase family 1